MARIETEKSISEYANSIAHIGYTPKDIIIRSTLLTQEGIDAGFTRENVKNSYVQCKTVEDAFEKLETLKEPEAAPEQEEPSNPDTPDVSPTVVVGEVFTASCKVNAVTLKKDEWVTIPPVIFSVTDTLSENSFMLGLGSEGCVFKNVPNELDNIFGDSNYGGSGNVACWGQGTDSFVTLNDMFSEVQVMAKTDNAALILIADPEVSGLIPDYQEFGRFNFKVN